MDKNMRRAREEILKKVNDFRANNMYRLGLVRMFKPMTMRNIQKAVCIARQNKLVAPTVLEVAGYNSERKL